MATEAFERAQQTARNEGFVPSFVPGITDPLIGRVTSTVGARVGATDPGAVATPYGYYAEEEVVEDVTRGSFYAEFAALSQEEQEAYAEAMFAAGLGNGLGIENLEDIYQSWAIEGMLARAVSQAEKSAQIGRMDELPTFDQRFAGQEETSRADAMAYLEEMKPETRFIDRATLEDTAQSYFSNELGRKATESELKSFVAGIHAAQEKGETGQELGVGGRARRFALEADPERAAGMDYSQSARLAMTALGMK